MVIPVIYLNIIYPDIEWDWNSIDAEDIHFPKSFSWVLRQQDIRLKETAQTIIGINGKMNLMKNNSPRIHIGEKSSLAADHWNKYPDDIKLMKQLGVNHYRFSIEWSKIEPRKGVFDYKIGFEHYRNI